MSIRALIVDDEKLARSRLRRLLAAFSDIAIAGEAANGQEALTLIAEVHPDLIFLDIRMPLLSGLEMLSHLDESPYIIFTTAFDAYALEAFEANTLDYLLKPIVPEKLGRAVDKARRVLGSAAPTPSLLEPLIESLRRRETRIERFSVSQGHQIRLVSATEVDFFQAEDKVVLLKGQGLSEIIPFTLKELESRLDPARFLRVHRNAIVNLDRVLRVERWFGGRFKLGFSEGREVEVSSGHAARFKEKIGL